MAENVENDLRRHDGSSSAEYIEVLVSTLLDLRARTDPASSEVTAKGKDLAAFEALRVAGKLVGALVGWAIDHQIGLASEGLAFVPLQPYGTTNHPEYLEARAAVDDHRHEYTGAALRASRDGLTDLTVARQLIINLLQANPGGFPPVIARLLLNAQQDREYGRIHQLMIPNKTFQKVTREEQQLQLSAIAFVNYRVGRGKTKSNAVQEVADAYGVSRDTILSWGKRLREELGSLEVLRRISFARNAASWAEAELKATLTGAETDRGASWDERYGEKPLQRAAQSYRAVKRERKTA